MKAITGLGGIGQTFGYDLDYRTTSDTASSSGTSFLNLAYGYDNNDNLTSVTDSLNAANTQTLGYDVINRLTSAASSTGGYGSYGYTLDKVGNRLTQTLGSATTTYSYTSGTNRLASILAGGVTTPVSTNGNGNITSIPTANTGAVGTFAYNVANRLSSVTGASTAYTATYDAFGRRIIKTDTGTNPSYYTYGLDSMMLEENDNGTVTDYIYANGTPVGTFAPATSGLYYVLTDRQGTPQKVTNSSQAVVWSTTYQPFGTTGTVTASITQNLRFPGQFADPETGFYYNQQRDYMPNLGRYLQSDPIGLAEGPNTYVYLNADPMLGSDTTGLGFCIYNSETGEMRCLSTTPLGSTNGGTAFTGQFASGNNNVPGCMNNPACEKLPNVGPIPTGTWEWNQDEPTTKQNANALDPMDDPLNDPDFPFDRDAIRTHSCQNPWGPTATAGKHVCSAGCVTATVPTAQKLKRFLNEEWAAGQKNTLFVYH